MNHPIDDLVGKHVSWKKIKSKSNATMRETTGFGVFSSIKLERSMVICGDYGVTTSAVKIVLEIDGGFKVTTRNSVYIVREVNNRKRYEN
jgi:hypothetical protein